MKVSLRKKIITTCRRILKTFQKNPLEKKIFWLVESNNGLSIITDVIQQAQEIIEEDFKIESEGGEYSISDLQYTVIPVLMTQDEFNKLESAD